MQYIKNNYYRSFGTGPTFRVEFDKFSTQFQNHFIESRLAAAEIYENRQGKFYLMYSGGLDSEFALSCFLSLGINVVPVIVKLCPIYNQTDINYALEFCKSKNLKPVIIDINLDNFVESGLIYNIAKEMQCSIYHRSALAHAITQLDGTVICGDCEPYVRIIDNKWFIVIDEHEFSMQRWYTKHNVYGTPNFGCYTAEKFISYMSVPIILQLTRNQLPGKLSSFSSKHIIYNTSSNFNLKNRPKLTGYEEMEKSDLFKHEIFKEFELLKTQYGGVNKLEVNQFINEFLLWH